MFRNRQNRIYLTICASTLVALCSTGCRSGLMPRMNMFGMRSEPSAEALAGNGPTTTYPSPPSETATPQAIASIAAGTTRASSDPITSPIQIDNGTAQVAGLNIDPGYVTPASSSSTPSSSPTTNMAAAQANGIFNEKAPSYITNNAQPAGPSGYQYGSKGTSPDSVAPSTTPPSSIASNATPPASMTPPSSYSAPASASAPASFQGGGFTMPDNVAPTVASSAIESNTPAPSMMPPSIPPVSAQPEHRIATSDSSSMIPAIDTGAPTSAPSTSAGGYSPGSTAGATGYPAGGYTKPNATGGSYYR